MNSDDLSTFALVAKHASVSRAAMAVGADQSTLSRRIGALESELGVRLFHRSGRGVTLTERGTALLAYAEQVAGTLQQASQAMLTISEQGPARVCIAAQPTIARMLFGPLGHALKARFAHTQLHFVEGLAAGILERLGEGSVDIALLYVPEHPGAQPYDALLVEDVHLITPPDYPLPNEPFEVPALGTVPLILPSTHHGLRVLVDRLGQRHGFTPRIALECDGSISITKRLVLAGCGCTVLPQAAVVEEVNAGRLNSLRLVGPAVQRTVAMAWPKNRALAEGLWQVAHVVRRCCEKQVASGQWPGASLAIATG